MNENSNCNLVFLRDFRKLWNPDSSRSRSSSCFQFYQKKKGRKESNGQQSMPSHCQCEGMVLFTENSRALLVGYSGGKWILPTTRRFYRLYMRPNKKFISYRLHVVSVCYIWTRVVAFTVWRFIIRFIIFIATRNIFMWITIPFSKLLLQKNKVMRVLLYSEECRKIKRPIMCTCIVCVCMYVCVCTHDCILDKKFEFTTVYPRAKSFLTDTDPCWHAREAMMRFNAGNHFLCGIAAI